MAERKRGDTSKIVKNSLLSAADFGFPYENFAAPAVLLSAPQTAPNNTSLLPEDVGEVDSFVGQNTSISSGLSPFQVIPASIKPVFTSSSISGTVSQSTFTPISGELPSYQADTGSFFTPKSVSPHSLPSFPAAPNLQFHLPTPQPVTSVSESLLGFTEAAPSNYDSASRSYLPQLHASEINQTLSGSSSDLNLTSTPSQITPSVSPGLYESPSPAPLLPQGVLAPSTFQVLTPPTSNTSLNSQHSSLLSSIPPVNPVPLTSVASGTGTNTYRLGSQRKLQYAQPPGLSVSSTVQHSSLPNIPSATPPPISFPNLTSLSDQVPQYSAATPSAFVPTPVQGSYPLISPPPTAATAAAAAAPALPSPSASPFLTPSPSTVSFSSSSSTLSDYPLAQFPPSAPTTSHSTPSVASYFPSPIVAAATAMAATVAAANGAPQFQTPVQTPTDSSVVPASFANLSSGLPVYRPVYHHWFLKKEVESKILWVPFSMSDSLALEEAFTSTDISPDTVVATDGGRYDVNVLRRQRVAVYWKENPTEVRRCSWFYKGAIDSRYVPYEESVATKLEEEFRIAMTKNEWHRRVELGHGETVVFHGPNVMAHFPQASSPDAWGNTPQVPTRPRVVKRGVDEFNIDEGEPPTVDHLLFLVHGVGSACDLKFRTVEEVVEDFRSLSLQLVQSHFRTSVERGQVNRIEVLPVSWHSTLHSDETGIDHKLKSITLPSIPRLRHFTNDTLLDILFYTSPVYCETIIHTVGKEINRLYELFCSRHPSFKGGISLGGHSLGSLILFDLLCHQDVPQTQATERGSKLQSIPSEDAGDPVVGEEVSTKDKKPVSASKTPPHMRRLSRRVSYVMGNAGTGQPFITYPQLAFQPRAFFAMGSPIGMFVTVRGIDALGEDFKLPTCPGFFNIFHPFDPVAYRIETLIKPELSSLKPVMIPHHKGRKRMHLELKETMARVGADLKQRILDSLQSTWNTVYQIAMFHRSDTKALEQEVDKVLEEQMQHQETESSHSEEADLDVAVGELNGGRRVDYVLQEAPLESFNEYLFALGSHVCYWESEDTMLMILKEIYSAMGISSDSNVPHVNTYERPSSRAAQTPDLHTYNDSSFFATPSSSMSHFIGEDSEAKSDAPPVIPSTPIAQGDSNPSLGTPNPNQHVGMDPTAPPSENKNLGPPPISGFVRK